jgi:RimJ/RimL family protein N-acetyltransferase
VTERLIVRSTQPPDAAAVGATLDDEVLTAHGWREEDRQSWVECIERGELQPSVLAVCDRATGQVLGTVSVAPSHMGFQIGSVGVMLGPDGRGRGIAAEALSAALPYFHSLGLEELVIETDEDNIAMRRSAEAVGATLAQRYTHELPNGRRVAAVRYRHVEVAAPE